jgi:hypothetical protein
MTKTKLLDVMAAYLSKNGPMTPAEYGKRKDAPARLQVLRRTFRSWSGMLRYIESRTEKTNVNKDAKAI